MAALFAFIVTWMQLLVPQPCFDEFFINYNFFHVTCLKIVISKCLGYGIIVASVIVKVPQILKIVHAGSAEGLSILSSTMELVAITGSMVYGFAMSYPFSAYGEAVFLLIQTAVIAFLILSYTRGTQSGFVYITVYAAVLSFLLSPAAPMTLLWALQASVMPLVASARMIQAMTNYRNQSTGQLSPITVLLLFLGSIARVFTSIQETGDHTIIATYIVSSLCNGVLAFQLAYYWNAKPSTAQKHDKHQ
jgi:mannose-P-dolichol utilization defect protein 1